MELPTAGATSIDKLPSMHVLKEPDSRFADMEIAAEKHADLANTRVDRSQRKALRRLGGKVTDIESLIHLCIYSSKNDRLVIGLCRVGSGISYAESK